MPTNKLDPRWQSWAQGICEGASLAQRKWSGRDRPFRRSEYEDGLRRMAAHGYLILLEKRGYRPNRAGGWRFVLEMSRGMAQLPPPPLGTSSPQKNIPVRRARTAPRSKIHTILHMKEQEKMKTVLVHQGMNRTIFYLYNDRGVCVARLEKPGLLTEEQQQDYARQYKKDHPKDFPGEKVEGKDE